MMHRYRWILSVIFLATALASYAWYAGFVPLWGEEERARLRGALHLRWLPAGTTVIASGRNEETSTYTFEAVIAIRPETATTLLNGRPFQKVGAAGPLVWASEPYRIHLEPSPPPLVLAESWVWSGMLLGGELEAQCVVSLNATRDRAVVSFASN